MFLLGKSYHRQFSCVVFVVTSFDSLVLFADSDQVMLQEGWLVPVVGREVFCLGVHLH